ncbi:MAG: NAD(P)/FAD-dependent oxidoreductase, partial [Spirochaetaceae bacterium]
MKGYDVAIIGGGLIGCAIARELALFDVSVVVLEKSADVGRGASKANSGIIHGGYDARHGTTKAATSYRGNQAFDRLEEELNFGFERTGSLVLAFDEADKQKLAELLDNGQLNGVKGLRLINGPEAIEMEPSLNPAVKAALYAPHTGICSPYEYTIALAENAAANGVDFRLSCGLMAVEQAGQGFRLISGDGSTVNARRIINAAGVYSGQIAAMFGETGVQIVPRMGQYLLFRKGSGDDIKQVLFQVPNEQGKGVLVTRTYHGNLMIGPNAQYIEDPDELLTDLETLKAIMQTARKTMPDCLQAEPLRTFSGVRATSATGDFMIFRQQGLSGCIHVAGIDSPG